MHRRTLEKDFTAVQGRLLKVTLLHSAIASACTVIVIALIEPSGITYSGASFLLGLPLAFFYSRTLRVVSDIVVIHHARKKEEALRGGKKVIDATNVKL
jgi:hypothetical protein